MLIDSHCHLDFDGLAERLPEVLARAEREGVGRVVTISTYVRRFETGSSYSLGSTTGTWRQTLWAGSTSRQSWISCL